MVRDLLRGNEAVASASGRLCPLHRGQMADGGCHSPHTLLGICGVASEQKERPPGEGGGDTGPARLLLSPLS